MIDRDLPASEAEQARLDLSVAASTAERTNKPKGLLYFAIFLLAIAAIYAITGLTARATSLARVASTRESASRVIKLTGEVRQMQSSLTARGVDPNPRIGFELEELAKQKGATPATTISEDRSAAPSIANMQQKVYKARFVDQQPVNLLNFLTAVPQNPATAGVEINRLGIRPGTPDPATGEVRWNLDVDFTRWERKR